MGVVRNQTCSMSKTISCVSLEKEAERDTTVARTMSLTSWLLQSIR